MNFRVPGCFVSGEIQANRQMTDSRSESAKAAPVQRKIAGSPIPILLRSQQHFRSTGERLIIYFKPDEPSDVVQRGHHHLQVRINKCCTGLAGGSCLPRSQVSQHVCAVFPPTSNYLRLPSPPAQPTLIRQLRISSSSSPRTFFSYLHIHSISFIIPDAHESRYRRRATPPDSSPRAAGVQNPTWQPLRQVTSHLAPSWGLSIVISGARRWVICTARRTPLLAAAAHRLLVPAQSTSTGTLLVPCHRVWCGLSCGGEAATALRHTLAAGIRPARQPVRRIPPSPPPPRE